MPPKTPPLKGGGGMLILVTKLLLRNTDALEALLRFCVIYATSVDESNKTNRRCDMQRHWMTFLLIILLGAIFMSCAKKEPVIKNYEDVNVVKEQVAKFTPVEIGYDESVLSEGDKKALLKLVQAGHLMDEIFLRQVYDKNVAIQEGL